MESDKIILYDIPGYAAEDRAWSPNPWKARFVLNMKGLAYRTVWVEYPDIASLHAKLRLPRAGNTSGLGSNQDNKPFYGLPVIYDPMTDRVVSDSQNIAQYLEETYPTARGPLLFPSGTKGLQAMFVDIFIQKISAPLHLITSIYAMRQLPPRSSDYYSLKRSARYGKPLADLAPEGSESRAAVWASVRDAFKEFDKWTNANGCGSIFIMGETLCFADVAVASYLTWFKRLMGTRSIEWQELMSAENGRWRKLVEVFSVWEVVDKEGLAHVIH